MVTSDRKLRVFLCHASQDKPVVRELYQRLRAEGWIDPWLDEEKLLPGQDWDMEIEKAVEVADAVIVCLSNSSISKEGYVQKEIRFALNVALEKPEGVIFIVPLRLDKCSVPRSLQSLHYIDYFPAINRKIMYERLLSSLIMRASVIGVQSENMKMGSESESVKNDSRFKKPSFLKLLSKIYASPETSIPQEKVSVGNVEFIKIPSGPFIMGSKLTNPLGSEFETPQNTVNIKYDFWISRFLVTNLVFAEFLERERIFHTWTNGWKNKLNHPVVNVTEGSADRFCQWFYSTYSGEINKFGFDEYDDYIFRLPTEAEWEKSARGMDGREWPWGDEFDHRKCNVLEGARRYGTTPVGAYSPKGDSPFGVADVAGNVWELTNSPYKRYPYRFNEPYIPWGNDSDGYVIRGGSYIDNRIKARTPFREKINPESRGEHIGFRFVIAPSWFFDN